MEQQEQQNLLLSNYDDREMEATYLKKLWVDLYGPLEKKEKKGKTAAGLPRYDYIWDAEPFRLLSQDARRDLTKALIKSDKMFEKDSSLRDEFYGRICSVLNFLLSDLSDAVVVLTPHQAKEFPLKARILKILPDEQMEEIRLWHQWGLPISSEEKRLLKKCLKKFLPNKPRSATALKRAHWVRAEAIYAESKTLSKSLRYYLRLFEKKSAEMTARGENPEELKIISDEKFAEIGKKVLSLRMNFALCRSFPILDGNFRDLETVLSEKKTT